jgi:hypothetical protein
MPISTTSYVSKTGLPYVFLTDPVTGELLNVTAVNTTPTFTVNGAACAVTGPWWADATHCCPWAAYRPIVPIVPTDVVTITTVDGWATCGKASVPGVVGGVVRNWVGVLEPGIGKLGGIPMPGYDAPRTMKVGFNPGWGFKPGATTPASLTQNWWHRIGYTTGVLTSDANGRPLSINGTLSAALLATPSTGAVDGRGMPIAMGTVRLVVNETSPAAPMTIAAALNGASVQITGPVVTPGTIVNGVEMRKTWTWTTSYTSTDPASFQASLAFYVRTADGKPGAYTLQDERLLMPGNDVMADDPLTIDANVKAWLTTDSGRTPAILRFNEIFWGFDGNTSAVVPTDRRQPGEWSWANPRLYQSVAVASVRTYDLGVSPDVWFDEAFPNATAVPGVPATYQIAPADVGYQNYSGPGGGWFVFEVVTAAPHPFRSGQAAIFAGSALAAIPVTNGNGPALTASLVGASLEVFKTSPTSFAGMGWRGNFVNAIGQLGGVNNVVGTNVVTGATATVSLPDSAALPVEAGASIAGQLPGTDLWLNTPGPATDDAVTAIVTAALSTLPTGRNVYVERWNEVWSYINAHAYDAAIGNLATLAPGPENWLQTYVRLTAHHHDVATAAANVTGRGGSIKRVFATQYGGPGTTAAMVLYAGQKKVQIDVVSPAPYVGTPSDPTLTYAAASVYAPDSRLKVAAAEPNPFSVAQWIDLLRHYLKYNTRDNGPNGLHGQQRKALSGYVPVNGQPAGFVPSLVAYECGLQLVLPDGVSDDPAMRMQEIHDIVYSPAIADAIDAVLGSYQLAGYDTVLWYNLCMQRQKEAVWGATTWAGQKPGPGLSNKSWLVDHQGHDDTNESVVLYALRRWMDTANVIGGPPPPASASATCNVTSADDVLAVTGTSTIPVSIGTWNVTENADVAAVAALAALPPSTMTIVGTDGTTVTVTGHGFTVH